MQAATCRIELEGPAMAGRRRRTALYGSDFIPVLDLEREETGKMRGLKIRIADTESQEKNIFPNVITQSKPTETAETAYSRESLGRGTVWLGRCLNETGTLI